MVGIVLGLETPKQQLLATDVPVYKYNETPVELGVVGIPYPTGVIDKYPPLIIIFLGAPDALITIPLQVKMPVESRVATVASVVG
jgi:hypothetical protein